MQRMEPMAIRRYTYSVVFTPEPEGGYTVTCPALPGLVTYGYSLEEARRMAVEAIQGHLEGLEKAGDPLPPGDENAEKPILDEVTVEYQTA
jgi:predicted RNase H-like HicB family nuclease